MRVFVDTNVWISAYTGSKLCMELLLFCQQRHHLVVSADVLDEFQRIVVKKLKLPETLAHQWRGQIESQAQVRPRPTRVAVRCRDPKDDAILQAALDADCGWLVSGDADLTTLKRVKKMPITTPRDFLEALGVEEEWV